jgi:hypothetical protein
VEEVGGRARILTGFLNMGTQRYVEEDQQGSIGNEKKRNDHDGRGYEWQAGAYSS